MLRIVCTLFAAMFGLAGAALAGEPSVQTFKTGLGELRVTGIGHASLLLEFGGKAVHVDPWLKVGDYAALPKADLILITHDHRDHADAESVTAVRQPATELIGSRLAVQKLGWGKILENGGSAVWNGMKIEAVPAYNVIHKRDDGTPFHPKGVGNGYVLTFGEFRLYIAGDTEDIPEMANLRDVDAAFLPVNLPYTMTVDMLVHAARTMRPKILYPYHTGDTDMAQVERALSGVPGVKTVILPLR